MNNPGSSDQRIDYTAVLRYFKAAGNKTDLANRIGKVLAQRAKEKKITQVVFDRNGYVYHGRVKALAEGAREGGLKI